MALRGFVKSPGFSIVVVATLALGIGANTAIFELLDAVRLRTLPVSKPNELAELRIVGGNHGFGINRWDVHELHDPDVAGGEGLIMSLSREFLHGARTTCWLERRANRGA